MLFKWKFHVKYFFFLTAYLIMFFDNFSRFLREFFSNEQEFKCSDKEERDFNSIYLRFKWCCIYFIILKLRVI